MATLRRWLLPHWAQSDHPLLQYELTPYRGRGGRGRFAALAVLLGGSAAIYAAAILSPAGGANPTSLLWRSLYYPTLILQLATMMAALTLGAAAVGGERSRKTWESLRATEFGAGLALRARWAGILYRLRAPICAILLARIFLKAGMIYDLTAFDGLYAQMLAAQASPPLPAPRLELPLIALAATVALLLPVAQIAVAAAFGILLSVAVRERLFAALIHALLIACQLALAAAGAFALSPALQARAPLETAWSYALALAYSAFGDWGLLAAQLGSLGEIWRGAAFGWTISPALALLLFALGLAADGMMWLAGRLSERRG